MSPSASPKTNATLGALTLSAIGVVFGDIGTSPLYALHTVFSADHNTVRPDEASVYGVISLVFWAITVVVSLKYVTFILRADNDGEGGIMALIALIQGVSLRGRLAKLVLVALGIFGASLFYGDGMITPAISVLSAVEGLEVAAPALEPLILPIALAILTMLFSIQRFGTKAVGRLFGPVMALWFAILAVAGIAQVLERPEILKALSPTYGLSFMADNGHVAFVALGAVVLAITGAEALYADMGHYGRAPIRRGWFFFVFPALTLNYLGQGSLILEDPKAIENPFFLLFPGWAAIPMVVLATAATVIASQAVISGAFSVTRQAVALGFLPRLTIRHTSEAEGQIYVPAINWGIFVAVVGLVVGFGSSERLASAYGIAVTGTLAIDTILFFVVVRALWHKPLWLALGGAVAFLVVDLAFLSANLSKVLSGGWFPLIIAMAIFLVLTTWQKGREAVTTRRIELEGPLKDFVEEVRDLQPPVFRVPNTGVFLNARSETTPLALRANLDHNRALHEAVVIVSLETMKVPHVPESERLVIDDLGYRNDGISHIVARYGFQDDTDVPALVRLAQSQNGLESEIDCDTCSYFLSKITIATTGPAKLARWRKRLFVAISRNSADPVEYFALPLDRTVTVGSQIDL